MTVSVNLPPLTVDAVVMTSWAGWVEIVQAVMPSLPSDHIVNVSDILPLLALERRRGSQRDTFLCNHLKRCRSISLFQSFIFPIYFSDCSPLAFSQSLGSPRHLLFSHLHRLPLCVCFLSARFQKKKKVIYTTYFDLQFATQVTGDTLCCCMFLCSVYIFPCDQCKHDVFIEVLLSHTCKLQDEARTDGMEAELLASHEVLNDNDEASQGENVLETCLKKNPPHSNP